MWIWLLTSDEGDSQVCKNLFLRRWQEIADDESQGLDGQFLGGVELDGTRGSDDLRGISDRRFLFPGRSVRYLSWVKWVQRVGAFLQG